MPPTDSGGIPAFFTASRMVDFTASTHTSGHCSAQSARGVVTPYSASEEASRAPFVSMTMDFVPDVPMSVPIK